MEIKTVLVIGHLFSHFIRATLYKKTLLKYNSIRTILYVIIFEPRKIKYVITTDEDMMLG